MKYETPSAGEWVQPKRHLYKLMCCDCGLVHNVQFRLIGYGDGKKKIQFRAWRNERSTALARRHRKKKK